MRLDAQLAGGAGEGDDVADVLHTREVHDHTLEAEAEARMLDAAVTAQIEIPAIIAHIHAKFCDALLQHLHALFTLAAADELADTGNEKIRRSNGLAVVILAHVEGLDLFGIIRNEDGALKDLFGEIALVFGLQITAPKYGILELIFFLFEQGDRFGVADAGEVGVDHVFEALQQALIDELVEEFEFLGCLFEGIPDDVLDHGFRYIHIACKIAEGHFRLDHPELCRVAGRIGVFRTEGRAEGVDVTEGEGVGFTVELAADGQVGGGTEEILGEIHLAILGEGRIFGIQRGDAEHFTRTFAVAAGEDGSVDIYETTVAKETMDRLRGDAAHAEGRLEGVGTGTQMGDGAQELQRVALLLQGVVGAAGTLHGEFFRLDLKGLGRIGGHLQDALYADGGAGAQGLELFGGEDLFIQNDLYALESGAVHDLGESEILALAQGTDPTGDFDLAGVLFGSAQDFTDSFHGILHYRAVCPLLSHSFSITHSLKSGYTKRCFFCF